VCTDLNTTLSSIQSEILTPPQYAPITLSYRPKHTPSTAPMRPLLPPQYHP